MQQPNLPLLIFDCDGVLVDSEPISNRVFTQCLQQDGFAVDEAYAWKHFWGVSIRECLQHVEQVFQRKVSEGFVDNLSLLTKEEIRRNLKPIPHVTEVLHQIKNPKCVASGSEPEKLELSLQVTGLHHFFEHVFSSLEVERGKPFPDIFLHASQQLNYVPETCIVIEDSKPGVEAGLAAGMRVLLYSPADEPPFAVPKEVPVFKNMQQLPLLLQQYL